MLAHYIVETKAQDFAKNLDFYFGNQLIRE